MIGAVSSGVFSGVLLESGAEVVVFLCSDTPLRQGVTRWTCVICQRFIDEVDDTYGARLGVYEGCPLTMVVDLLLQQILAFFLLH